MVLCRGRLFQAENRNWQGIPSRSVRINKCFSLRHSTASRVKGPSSRRRPDSRATPPDRPAAAEAHHCVGQRMPATARGRPRRTFPGGRSTP